MKFDLSTIPASLLPETAIQNRAILEQSTFTVTLSRNRPEVKHIYPLQSGGIAQESVSAVVNWISSIIGGFFQTWPTKGMSGPLLPSNKWVDSISQIPGGYKIKARSANGLESIELTSDLLVTRVLSIGGKIDEHPVYLPTPDGLIYSGNKVLDNTEAEGSTVVKFEIENGLVDGFRLPQTVHLQVNSNVDVKFSLHDCSVERAKILALPTGEPSAR